ncbi:MAG: DUF3352 domain-containing protein [Elusimicrobiota bacterium]
MKNKNFFLYSLAAVITISLLFLVFYPYLPFPPTLKKEKKPVEIIDFSYERFIPASPTVLFRFENLNSVWTDFKTAKIHNHLTEFLQWLWNEMPSESFGFSTDIRDIQENIGFELSEENLLAFLGKRIMVGMWLENPEDRKILVISNLANRSFLSETMKKLLAQKIGIDEYRNITIDIFAENKYWSIVDDKLVISNDIGTIRNVIDLITGVSKDSFADDSELKNYLTGGKIGSANYIYINPQKLSIVNPATHSGGLKIKNEIEAITVSLKFQKGILIKSDIFFTTPFLKNTKTSKRIKSLRFIPENVFLYIGGHFVNIPAISETGLSQEVGCVIFPFNKHSLAVMLFCEVKNRKQVLNRFEELVKPTDNNFSISLPFLGSVGFNYFFYKKYFIVCHPPTPACSDSIINFIQHRKNRLKDTAKFKELNLSTKSTGIIYTNFAGLVSLFSKKDYLKFVKPTGGYILLDKQTIHASYYIPLTDLADSDWTTIFWQLRNTISKMIIAEKEKITRKNLLYLRQILSIYNSKTNRFPKKLDSLIDEYLNEIPQELLTKSNSVSTVLNGAGGWFYNRSQKKVMLNIFGTDSSGNLYSKW